MSDREDDNWPDFSILLGMTRAQFLAAEMFAYSFTNYADHLGIGNLRFEKLMPDMAKTLERAEQEGWSDERLAKAIEVEPLEASEWRKRYRDAVEVVDATTPAEGFRNAVRQVLLFQFGRQRIGDAEVESAVKQICYRVADLAYLLEQRGERLSDYSEDLQREETEPEDGNDI